MVMTNLTTDDASPALTDRLRSASVEAGLGLQVADVRPGQVDLNVLIRPGYVAADGRLSPVVAGIVADATVGIPAFAPASEPQSGVTVELRLDHVGGPAPTARRLEITGRVLGLGGETATGRAEIRDDLGTLVAHAVGLLAVDRPGTGLDPAATSDPLAPFDPTKIAPAPQGDGTAYANISPGMLNRRGTVHGGVLMGLAGEAQELFLGSHRGGHRLQLSMNYLRPASAGGRLILRSEFVRRGRRVCAVRTELLDINGKLVAVAHGTSAPPVDHDR
ncbi:PaaI family thioesterase [Streptomyces sp. NPDC005803]|uniref:PaaI family thioesterase n=1 Tax=Streptomyces sp. NPDC005803 TaxID=3154297 RepID=UPI0033CD8B68